MLSPLWACPGASPPLGSAPRTPQSWDASFSEQNVAKTETNTQPSISEPSRQPEAMQQAPEILMILRETELVAGGRL